jgi:hypothetical protein
MPPRYFEDEGDRDYMLTKAATVLAIGLPPSNSDEVLSGEGQDEDLSQAESNVSPQRMFVAGEERGAEYGSGKETSLKKQHVSVSLPFQNVLLISITSHVSDIQIL